MTTDPLSILQDRFRLRDFRPGQRQVIDHLLAGRSALAIFPTGGGKSLCYQLPALLIDGLTLVVSPLIALMQDQVDGLQGLGIAAARLDSSRSGEEVREIYRQLRSGELKLLYIAPERLQNERFLQLLHGLRIGLMAVDEAHCISEWGHNFRPDYLKLAQLARELKAERLLALTATATPEVAADICYQFGIDESARVQTGFYRENLQLAVTPCTETQKLPRLTERLQSAPRDPAIVYVTLQQTAETIADKLRATGLDAAAYHAGKMGHTWLTIEVQQAEQQIGEPRARILKALQFLEEQGCIETRAKGVRQGYRLLQTPDLPALTERLGQLFERREQQDLARLQQVLDYAASAECLPARLCGHFGEQLPQPCGICSSCRQAGARELPGESPGEIGEAGRQAVAQLIGEANPALAHPRQIARFLCGLPSPATVRMRRHPLFGRLVRWPFKQVLALAEQLPES